MTNIIASIAIATLQISSPSFNANDYIPAKFTCEGESISPELQIKNIPANTKTLAIVVFDPDAPNGGFVHWVGFNMPASETIPEKTVAGTMGNNGRGAKGYTGPCPPTGVHHYHFTVYALDTTLDLAEGANKEDLEKAMGGHIVGSGELIGLYKKMK